MDIARIFTSNKPYISTYAFVNPSLSSVNNDTERKKVLMQNRNILSSQNLKTGLKDRNILGLKTLIDTINDNNTQVKKKESDAFMIDRW